MISLKLSTNSSILSSENLHEFKITYTKSRALSSRSTFCSSKSVIKVEKVI